MPTSNPQSCQWYPTPVTQLYAPPSAFTPFHSSYPYPSAPGTQVQSSCCVVASILCEKPCRLSFHWLPFPMLPPAPSTLQWYFIISGNISICNNKYSKKPSPPDNLCSQEWRNYTPQGHTTASQTHSHWENTYNVPPFKCDLRPTVVAVLWSTVTIK